MAPIALPWATALLLSILLALAGQLWPEPLPIRPAAVWVLVLLPPLAMAVRLLANWSLPEVDEGRESDDRAQEQP